MKDVQTPVKRQQDAPALNAAKRQQDAPALNETEPASLPEFGQGRGMVKERAHAAIRNPYNVFFLSLAVAVTAAMTSIWPILIGLAIEAAYLLGSISSSRDMSVSRPSHYMPTDMSATSEASRDGVRRDSEPPALTAAMKRQPDAPALGGVEEPKIRFGLPPTAVGAKGGRSRAKKSDADTPALTEDAQECFLRIEATYRLIKLQVDESFPVYRELPSQLEYLMDRFVCFAAKQEELCDRLQTIETEASEMRSTQQLAPGVAELKLVDTSGDRTESLDLWVQTKIKRIHEGYERVLGEIAWQRSNPIDPDVDEKLKAKADAILKRNKYADKVAKTLLNLHYACQLLDKKFEMVSQELSSRRPDQVISDVKALVLQTMSLSRTVKDLEPLDSLVKSAAA